MKKYLLLAACLTLAGCGQENENHRALMTRLEALENEVSAIRTSQTNHAPIRVAYVTQHKISTILYQWQRDKMEEVKKSEALSPEVEQKISQYEALQNQVMRMQSSRMMARTMPTMRMPHGSETTVMTDEEYEALVKKTAEAKAPVAEIVDRRNHLSTQYRQQYSVEELIAEYVKGRFDLVTDSYDKDKFLYTTAGEVVDITDGVVALLRAKKKSQ